MNQIIPIINESSITLFPNGVPTTVRRDHINYRAIASACRERRYEDAEKLANVETIVSKAIENSPVSISGGRVLYDGTPIHNVVSEKLLSMIRAGDVDVSPWIKFIEKLMRNPSKNSVEQLYNFLNYKELPITEDGDVLGYKGLQPDFWSQKGNTRTRVICGKTNEQGQIFNGIGEIIEVERNSVVDNPNVECAEGIHIGSYNYAKNWAGSEGKLVLVKFSPEHAVSVPHADFEKLRVCRYEVIAEVGREISAPKVDSANCATWDNVKVSDEALKSAIEEYENDSGFEPTAEDLKEEGYVPHNSDVTEERVAALLSESVFAIMEDDDQDLDEEDEHAEKIVSRIQSYVRGNWPCTIRQIQSALSGFVNLDSDSIREICEASGYLVQDGPANKSLVRIGG